MISVALIGGFTPQRVQIIVDETPLGEPWTLTGSLNGFSWDVPGGAGIGNGGQLVLTDNRGPTRMPVVYTFTAAGASQVSVPIVVPSDSDITFEALDGSASLGFDWLDGSSAIEWALSQSIFPIPGRERPVVRFSTTGDGGGVWVIGIPSADTERFRRVVRRGAPVAFRCSEQVLDFPLAGVILPTGLSAAGYTDIGYREWSVPFLYTDDPYLDRRLGGFSWSEFAGLWTGRSWADFEDRMQGISWAEFAAFDWSLL